MEVYVLLNQDTTATNRYGLCKAADNKLLAEFEVIREVDAYVAANGYTYVAAPNADLIEDSKRAEVAMWYAEAIQQATLSALLHPEEYSQYLTSLGIEGKDSCLTLLTLDIMERLNHD